MTPRTILLLSASIGAGHDRPARELARRLNALGHRTEIVDLVEVAPLGRTLRWLFRFVRAHHPHIWGRMVADFEHSGQLPAGVRVVMRATGRRIARMLTELIGRGHVAGPRLTSLGTNFGLSPLIGKPLAIISDARPQSLRAMPRPWSHNQSTSQSIGI